MLNRFGVILFFVLSVASEAAENPNVVNGIDCSIPLARLASTTKPRPKLEEDLLRLRAHPEEPLVVEMARDDKFVSDRKLSHLAFANTLRELENLIEEQQNREGEFTYHGRPYSFHMRRVRGIFRSEFGDGTSTSSTYTVRDVQSGEQITFAGFDADQIERYGFYSSSKKPEKMLEMFPHILETAGKIPQIPTEQPMTPATVANNDKTPQPTKETPTKQKPPSSKPGSIFNKGGINSTAAILNITQLDGKSVEELEAIMRPGQSSHAGFLGNEESLVGVLAKDNAFVVDQMGLTHQKLSEPLEEIFRLAEEQGYTGGTVSYNGSEYEVKIRSSRGMQFSPIGDGATNKDISIINTSNGKSIAFSGLLPQLIREYGFYEGEGTRYRLSPQSILAVFPFLKP